MYLLGKNGDLHKVGANNSTNYMLYGTQNIFGPELLGFIFET